ncbi:MAG: STAS domain-containing protein [Nitrospirae bacterium]|nr:STAS domain-containing protein [Nitrospirota bacterium]
MNITTQYFQETALFTLTGKMDFQSHSHLLSSIEDAVHSGSQTINLDLQYVPFIDSLAIGLLVAAYKQLKGQDIQLQLVCPEHNSVVTTILQSLKVPELIPTFLSFQEALSG